MNRDTGQAQGFYHVGLLVPDLQAALPRYEAMLGVPFREPERRVLDGEEPGFGAPERHLLHVDFSFSVSPEGPWYELIEAGGETLMAAGHGEGIHHLGHWVDDMEACRAAQERAGMRLESRFFDDDGAERVFFTRHPLGGPRIESVNARMREEYDSWLTGAAARPGAVAAAGPA